MPPLVSVIIPVYNGANYLHDAIRSVLAQTLADYELLVVDDGSTDSTSEIAASYRRRVRLLRKANGGVSSALNVGIRESKGKYIAWLSHDDMFMPEKLEEQLEFLRSNPHLNICYTGSYLIDATGRIIREDDMLWFPPNEVIRALFRRTHINGSSVLIDRACFDSVGGFDERLRYTQDVEMWIRLAQRFEIGLLAKRLIKCRFHAGQGSRSVNRMRGEEEATFRRLYCRLGVSGILPELAPISHCPRAIAKAYEWFGDTMRLHHRWYAFAEEQYVHSLKYWPSLSNRARWKLLLVKVRKWVVGEDLATEKAIGEGRMLIGLGYVEEARHILGRALFSDPQRLDALMFWLVTWLGKAHVLRLRKIRHTFQQEYRRFEVRA